MTVKEKVDRLQRFFYRNRKVPPPVYLVCRAVDVETGEHYYFSASNLNVLYIAEHPERYMFAAGTIEILTATTDRNRARALAPELR